MKRYLSFSSLSILMLCLLFVECIPEDIALPYRIQSVTTSNATDITAREATLAGEVSLVDTDTITCGIIYGETSDLSAFKGTKVTTKANGRYTIGLFQLKDNTKYYYCAYAVDAGRYKLGKVRSFTTCYDASVVTGEPSKVAVHEASLAGEVNDAREKLPCGFIYSTSSDLSLEKACMVSTMSQGKYSITLTKLEANTTYYYRAYVVVDGEHRYGDVRSFTTETKVSESVDASKTYTVNGVSFTMIGVYGGTFTMGSPDSDSEAYSNEKPAHQVTLSNYYIGETEVTQALWQAVMGSNPSYYTGDLQRPVEQVSWDDCQTFISKLNELTGENFRLPTEAEWEYAARGGSASKGYKYSGSNNVDDVVWFFDNSSNKTHVVKTKQPNELGIYVMSGNVYEWCSDWYGSYSSSAQTNPTGPSSGSYRVFRGGSWCHNARFCRVANRICSSPGNGDNLIGLRLVR